MIDRGYAVNSTGRERGEGSARPQLYVYTCFSSFSAQATAASGDSPWTALANMSTTMYLDTDSPTLWSGWPGEPSVRNPSGACLNTRVVGGNLSQSGFSFCFGPMP